MKSKNLKIAVMGVAGLCFGFYVSTYIPTSVPVEPPPKYLVVTDGKVFRYVDDQAQLHRDVDYKTHGQARKAAWQYYRWATNEYLRNASWRPAPPFPSEVPDAMRPKPPTISTNATVQ